MCNGTSLCMHFDYDIGADKFPTGGKYEQYEDCFLDFMMQSKEVDEYYAKSSPAAYADYKRELDSAYTPNQIHAVLAYAFNLWVGRECDTFVTNATVGSIIATLDSGKCVTSSATFPYTYLSGRVGTIGHINVLVGYERSDLTNEVTQLIVDDPHGSVYQNFKAGTGNSVLMPFADFIKWYKPLGNANVKFAHFLRW
jgi:hypothetical protein